MVYGYSRCSTNETKQDINRQVRELKAAGAEEIFMEYEHGDAKIKSQQQAMFAQAQAGDTITVLEVSRLARSTQQLCEIIDVVREKHLRLVIVGSITLDCRSGQPDPMSEAFLQMAGVFPRPLCLHADGKAAAGNLFGIGLVDFWADTLESSGIKPIGENGGVVDDVLTGNHFFQIVGFHLCLDFIADGVSLGFDFLRHGLVFVQ